MNVAIVGHGGQGMTESIKAMLERGVLRVVDIEEATKEIQGSLEKKIRMLAEDLEDIFSDDPAVLMTSAAPEIKQIKIPEEHYAVMAYYGHIRDKPEKVGVITCLV